METQTKAVAYSVVAIGSYANNTTKNGAWSVCGNKYSAKHEIIERIAHSGKALSDTTDNQMQLTAAIQAIRHTLASGYVCIIVTNKYLLDGIRIYSKQWQTNAWRGAGNKPIANIQLWSELISLLRSPMVSLKDGNEREFSPLSRKAKCLAKKAATS